MGDEFLRIVSKEYNVKILWDEYRKVLGEFRRREERAREIRRKHANWEFINKQPEPIKSALKILVETGDIKLASMISGLKVGIIDEYRRKANIPYTII